MIEFSAEVDPETPHVLRVSGEVDIATVDDFLARARRALEGSPTMLEIDVAAVSFIDSSGLGALVRLRDEAGAAGKTIQLTHVPRQVTRVLELTGLSETFLDQPGD